MSGNLVIANVYGRTADGKALPFLVGPSGGLAPGPVTVTDWTTVADVAVLTPLVPWTNFADAASAVILGMRVESDSADGATFIIDASEDGVLVAKSSHLEYVLSAGEHDVLVLSPLMLRYLRLAVQPTNGGICKVSFLVRRIPR